MANYLFQEDLIDLEKLYLAGRCAESGSFGGRKGLRLDGLALLPSLRLENAAVEVDIAAKGAAYSGIIFRAADTLNHELAYAQPHTSTGWDAIQYDPIFHGGNSWQLYHGDAYQRAAKVPMGEWFTLRVAFQGTRASISVDGQEPLVVENLAHAPETGHVGLWSYLPAYFRNLRISSEARIEGKGVVPTPTLALPWQLVQTWFLERFGTVACEPNGILKLNRYLPSGMGAATVSRRFALAQETPVMIALGYSDGISLAIDGKQVHEGECLFHSTSANRADRGYVIPEHQVSLRLDSGEHLLSAIVHVREPFGWGLIAALQGEGITWLPAELG